MLYFKARVDSAWYQRSVDLCGFESIEHYFEENNCVGCGRWALHYVTKMELA